MDLLNTLEKLMEAFDPLTGARNRLAVRREYYHAMHAALPQQRKYTRQRVIRVATRDAGMLGRPALECLADSKVERVVRAGAH